MRSIVIALAKTGSDDTSRIFVMKKDHRISGIFSGDMFLFFIFIVVVIKLIDPKIEDTPATCNEKIVISVDVLF